ncbi:hypothetical protein HED60_07365 [Planctomycetales bacterium ZRK34]|nr:hypothetical protein HED60_07365 [Planctomycetales bacterium ZRK34]
MLRMLAQFDLWLLTVYVLLFVFLAAATIVGIVYQSWKHRRDGVKFPKREMVNIRYQERWASGNSHKTFFTRLGGANNCLNLVVTDDELWVRLTFPFNVFAMPLDLTHRIPLESITDLQRKKRVMLITYTRADGESRTISVVSHHPEQFWAALTDADRV